MSTRMRVLFSRMTALVCSLTLIPFTALEAMPDPVRPWTQEASGQDAKIPNEQLDSLVAPIALYPDPLLAQVLAASTYPLEIIQLNQWLEQHKDLKDQALADAVGKQDWDPTVQGLAGLPDLVKRLAGDITWTTDLGNAFLAQQSEVMSAVQRMRAKAKDKGSLQSNEQMKVETKTVESQQVIVIEQSNPQIIQVPSYDPVVVYGAPPPAYPYPPPGYYAAGMALTFGVGVMMGAMWSGGWCCNSGWGGGGNNTVNINNNNNFNRNSNINGGNRNNVNGGNRGQGGRGQGGQGGRGGGSWQHNSSHRGGAPYANQRTADKFGGTTRGSSQAARQNSARQQQARQQASGRQPGGDRGGAGGGRGGAQAGNMDRGGAGGGRGGAGGGDRMGNRSASSDRGGGGGGLGGGGGRGSSGSGARASSSRGASSRGGGGGGGGGRRR